MTRRLDGAQKLFASQCLDPDCTRPALPGRPFCQTHTDEAQAAADEWDQGADAARQRPRPTPHRPHRKRDQL